MSNRSTRRNPARAKWSWRCGSVGDRVAATTGVGGFAEQVAINARSIRAIPDSMTFGQAATFVQSYETMLFAFTRRTSVRAYWKQQRGYGEAEALLKFKHPDHFNVLGASHWRGRMNGKRCAAHI